MNPDLILHNAKIVTCDADHAMASAIAVWRDRICAIGNDDEVLRLAGPQTESVDLHGRFVCPGFIDCHVHLTSWAMIAGGRRVDLDGCNSLDEALDRIKKAAVRVPPGSWLRGRGWDKNHWTDSRFPTADDLDRVTGDTPAAFPSHDGHSLWANSAAMQIAGITPDVTDPSGGRILRDSQGHPTGIFQESAAQLISRHIPDPTPSELADALRDALPKASALGLTGVHNCEGADAMRAIQNVRDTGDLPLRVALYIPADNLQQASALGLQSGFGDEWLRIGGVKAFLDGALGSQTAAMLEPYAGTDDTGVLVMNPDDLEDLASRATQARMPLALHAIGDRAVRIALDAFDSARRAHDAQWPRHRIEHAQHIHPHDIPRCADIDITLSMQPAHLLADIDTCDRHLGERARWAFPFASVLDSGGRLAFGSDAPVETIDPLIGLRSAVLRQRRDATPSEGWYPEERISVAHALRAYTIDAAFAGGTDHIHGSLEVGKLADIVVLSEDIRSGEPQSLNEVSVLATIVGGRPVYDPEDVLA